MTPAITRRKFIAALVAGAASGSLTNQSAGITGPGAFPANRRQDAPRVGLALGAGGAKGLTHILMLEVFDELGITPCAISGSSMGAVIGALYASGLSGKQIRRFINGPATSDEHSWPNPLFRPDVFKWIDFIDPELGSGGLIDGENFIHYLRQEVHTADFDQLAVPLRIVAADFWKREQVVLENGPLLPAIQASMALPGLFTPVRLGDRVLVDGGTVNPVPWDLLPGDCDITVAIDVMGTISPQDGDTNPSFFDAIFNSVHIMQRAIVEEKLKRRQPDIYIRPLLNNIRMLEFYRADEIYRQTQPAKRELRQQLEKRLA